LRLRHSRGFSQVVLFSRVQYAVSMSYSRSTIEDLARLTRIQISPEEADRLTHQIGAILQYVERLQQVDVSSVVDGPVFQDALPPDRDLVRPQDDVAERVIQAFPDRVGNALRVPAVFHDRKQSA
jgi:aspartyl-tRNA(Asn)/glutamyl-tRNA(Gln) amidotransferase subunit C